MPGELARAFLLGGELGRAQQNVQRCYDRCYLFGKGGFLGEAKAVLYLI